MVNVLIYGVKNLVIKNCMIVANGKCTMCYRCVNNCAQKAITLLGKKVVNTVILKNICKKFKVLLNVN